MVLPGADHREVAFSADAFAAMHRFITGAAPASLAIVVQQHPLLQGRICGQGADNNDAASGEFGNNIGLAGASLEIYAVDAATGERVGAARYATRVGADGHWGPFKADAAARYEFVVAAPGYATSHVYRSPLPRSSSVMSMTARRIAAADRASAASAAIAAIVTLERPRGYFDAARDRIQFDGAPPANLPPAGAVIAESTLRLNDDKARAVAATFNGEALIGRTWRAADGHLTVLEITQ